MTKDSLSVEIAHYWLGRRGAPGVREVIEEIENHMQECRIMIRLDVAYGDILLDSDEWDVKLKCYDRVS